MSLRKVTESNFTFYILQQYFYAVTICFTNMSANQGSQRLALRHKIRLGSIKLQSGKHSNSILKSIENCKSALPAHFIYHRRRIFQLSSH